MNQLRIIQNDQAFKYYLGVHNAKWLHTRDDNRDIPLFLSRNRVPKGGTTGKKFEQATTDWATIRNGSSGPSRLAIACSM